MSCQMACHLGRWLVFLAALISFSARPAICDQDKASSDQAYATLLYGDPFLLAVRVLGQSIRETGTKRDMVAIVTGKVSQQAIATLQSDGWRTKLVDTVYNPGTWTQAKGFPHKFWAVYTKLQIFNLTEYKRVVYLDADTILMKNSDVMFNCPGFCAVLRHSERLNSGVMVVEPSHDIFEDMMSKIRHMPSYTGGDQGFLNSYFKGFANGFIFDPEADYSKATDKTMRLPTVFNADIGLYVVNSNRWMVPPNAIHVVHYTLGPFKPWVWWTWWMIRSVTDWQALRWRLPPDAAGRLHGRTPRQLLAERFLWLLPLLTSAALCWRLLRPADFSAMLTPGDAHARSLATGSYAYPGRGVLPRFFIAQSIAAGFASLGAGVLTAILVVPPEVAIHWGWILSFEWGIFVWMLLLAGYLRLCYCWGCEAASKSSLQVSKVNPRPWSETLLACSGLCLVLVLAPFVGSLLGVKSFVGNIVCTVFTAVMATILATHVFAVVPIKWYICGRAEGMAK